MTQVDKRTAQRARFGNGGQQTPNFGFNQGAFPLGGGTQQVEVSSSSSKSGGGGSGGAQKIDPQAQALASKILEILNSNTTDIKKEKQSLEERLKYHQNQMLAAGFLSFGGSAEAASAMAQASGQEIAKLQYLISQIDSNPDLYMEAKKTGVVAELGPLMQGLAGLVTSKYTPEAYAVQKYAAGASYAQANAYGRGGSAQGGTDIGGEIDYALKLIDSMKDAAVTTKQRKEIYGMLKALGVRIADYFGASR